MPRPCRLSDALSDGRRWGAAPGCPYRGLRFSTDGYVWQVAVWPVYIWRPLFEEDALEFSTIGQEVAWVVELVEGAALHWPDDVLVDTTVEIERPPTRARRGALARTADFRVLWEGDEPAGTVLRLRAALSAEWTMPAFRITAKGVIRRIQVVSRRAMRDAENTTGRSAGRWHWKDVERSPRWLGLMPRPGDPPEALYETGC